LEALDVLSDGLAGEVLQRGCGLLEGQVSSGAYAEPGGVDRENV
jgi:hypothetical protein